MSEATSELPADSTENPPRDAPQPLSVRDLFEAGVHFGHQTKRWNPKDAPLHLRRSQRHPHCGP